MLIDSISRLTLSSLRHHPLKYPESFSKVAETDKNRKKDLSSMIYRAEAPFYKVTVFSIVIECNRSRKKIGVNFSTTFHLLDFCCHSKKGPVKCTYAFLSE